MEEKRNLVLFKSEGGKDAIQEINQIGIIIKNEMGEEANESNLSSNLEQGETMLYCGI